MTENETESLDNLCKEYLELSSRDIDERAIQEFNEEMEEWEERMEELDEDDPLYDTARENYEEAKKKYEEEISVSERRDELEERILSRVISEFSIGEATSTQLRAINLILVGVDRESIPNGCNKVGESSELGDVEMFDLSMVVRDLAEEELGKGQEISDYLMKFKDRQRYNAFKIVASRDGMIDTKVLADELDVDDRNTAGQMIIDENSSGDYKPYYANEGEYSLSIVGEYIARNYSDIEHQEGSANDEQETVESLDSFSDS